MILDSSALVAVILAEPGYDRLLTRMGDASALGVGAPTVAEAAIVLSARLRRDARPLLNELLREAEVEIVPFGPEHYSAAVTAFQKFGKGRHRAALNFGDCLAYAVAELSGLPLLFTGSDFSKTDIQSAL